MPPGYMGVPEEDANDANTDDESDEPTISKERIPVNLATTTVRPDDEMRNMYVTKKIIDEFGETPGCSACAARKKRSGPSRSSEGRHRLRMDMSKTETGSYRLACEQARTERHEEKTIIKRAKQDPDIQIEIQRREDDLAGKEGEEGKQASIHTQMMERHQTQMHRISLEIRGEQTGPQKMSPRADHMWSTTMKIGLMHTSKETEVCFPAR